MGRKLFCDISPTCYEISLRKEIMRRYIKDFFCREKIAHQRDLKNILPNIVKSHSSILIRKLHGVDLQLQENIKMNIQLK